ncbi:retinol dehydrogenase 13-like [Coccinella septempunctata]|uniref:retinol dehydrogenase 13-like n=1 Tax=Coccinella septempunctata TaxID=41139 RepID=UPI001D08FFBF|nr:retinol dehydrogenase 13-like [Coccinella septempunctata]
MGILSSKLMCNARLDGKTAVVTGCNAGIGKETVRDFYRRGAKVIMACRNVEAANEAAEDIKTASKSVPCNGLLRVVHLDLSNLKSVKECVENLLKNEERIDVLVNNAGVMMCPPTRTPDGFEMQFGTNHLGHFLFTLLLLPRIIRSRPSRIVIVSSCLHSGGSIVFGDLNWVSRPYDGLAAYKQSKLANILFAKELARRLGEKNVNNVNTYSLHPGVVATDLSRHLDTYQAGLRNVYDFLARFFAKNVEQGARTTVYCAVHENCASETGLYYGDCRVKKPSRGAEDLDVARKLWEVSWEIVGLGRDYDPFEVVQ